MSGSFYELIKTRAVYHFYGKFPDHPITTGEDIYPVVEKTHAERVADLEAVDKYVHNTFTYSEDVWYRTDLKTDNWNFLSVQGLSRGDCEDFVITKIQWLLELGWSIENLTIETGFKRNEETGEITGHAWLVVRWGSEEYVLDKGNGQLQSRAELKAEWPFAGWAQIGGKVWTRVHPNGDVSTNPYHQFEIVPMPYEIVNSPVLTMTGTVRRKR